MILGRSPPEIWVGGFGCKSIWISPSNRTGDNKESFILGVYSIHTENGALFGWCFRGLLRAPGLGVSGQAGILSSPLSLFSMTGTQATVVSQKGRGLLSTHFSQRCHTRSTAKRPWCEKWQVESGEQGLSLQSMLSPSESNSNLILNLY